MYSATVPHDDIEMIGSPDRDPEIDKERDTESVSMPSPNIYSAPNGCFHLEIIDEGVGMAAEDCKQLFKSIVQFNPNELQVRQRFLLSSCTSYIGHIDGNPCMSSNASRGFTLFSSSF